MERQYYSSRTGINPLASGIDLSSLRRLFETQVSLLRNEGYLHEHFGFYCVDAGFIPGTLGERVEDELFFSLRKHGLWPIDDYVHQFSEDDIFDLIGYLYDHCSEPTSGQPHTFMNCGPHWDTFVREPGRILFRERMNRLLRTYGAGFELSVEGEVQRLPQPGLEPLLQAALPSSTPETVAQRVASAKSRFLRHDSTLDDRHAAVRDLADALESMRNQVKQVLLSKDESDLFLLANTFGIRHLRADQKINYDREIWLSWMFYHYLATIHATLRLIAKQEAGEAST